MRKLLNCIFFSAVCLAQTKVVGSGPWTDDGSTLAPISGRTVAIDTTLSAKNIPVSVIAPPYNAKCDGITDDSAAFAAAVNHGKVVTIPAGFCVASIALTASYQSLVGQGIGISTIRSPGASPPVTVASGGAATLYGVRVAGLSLDSSHMATSGLAVFDVAESRFESLEATNSTGIGVNCQICINDLFRGVVSHHNGSDGVYIGQGTKSSTVYGSSADTLTEFQSHDNTGVGVHAENVKHLRVADGDVTSNAAGGVLLYDSSGTTVRDNWVEGNGNYAVKNDASGDIQTENRIVWNHTVGGSGKSGDVVITLGQRGSVEHNYIGGVLNVTANASYWFLGRQERVITLTDNGYGTVNWASQNTADLDWKGGGTAGRFHVSVGSTATLSGTLGVNYNNALQTAYAGVAASALGAAPAAGVTKFCTDCALAATCATGGTGHLAVSNGSAWTCQ